MINEALERPANKKAYKHLAMKLHPDPNRGDVNPNTIRELNLSKVSDAKFEKFYKTFMKATEKDTKYQEWQKNLRKEKVKSFPKDIKDTVKEIGQDTKNAAKEIGKDAKSAAKKARSNYRWSKLEIKKMARQAYKEQEARKK